MIELINDTIDRNDINSLIEWLKTYPRLTKGNLTVEFERRFADYIGSKYSVYVNSGSSANLIMLYTLVAEGLLSIGDTVVVPALSWATDLSPVIQLGLKPILCDCNMEDLSIDLDDFREICKTQNPKALMMVSVLGLVPEMDSILEICNEYGVHMLEDTCESLGSEYKGRKLGTFGKMSSFSMYFGHHISTIEGGMVCTDDEKLYNTLKSLRSHGWDRDLDQKYKNKFRYENGINEFNALYTFYYAGFNLRATDLQAQIGLGQINKIPEIVQKRNENFQQYLDVLADDIWKPINKHFVSNFAYPIIISNRDAIIEKMNENKIAVRPLICGSMATQPIYKKYFIDDNVYMNACRIDNEGLYLPNHPDLTEEQINLICLIINEEK